ncbi:MAG: helix-turn-helix transcriptional regulator [Acidobacteria bacterium]|nr:helix-turn-helix transcriptional regulator [Acidobacteriota bacterium]
MDIAIFFEVLDAVYDAAGDPNAWLQCLERLRDAVSGSSAHFVSVTPAQQRSVALSTLGDPEAFRVYNEHWGARDPWGRSPRVRAIAEPTVVLGDELVPHSAFTRTDFYDGFGRPYDIGRCVVGFVETGPRNLTVLTITRADRQRAFATQEAAFLHALLPHLQRSLQLQRRLAESEAASRDVASVVDHGRHAVMLVDGSGRVTYMNGAANRLLAARDGLVVDGRELEAAASSDTARLRSLIQEAAGTSARTALGAGGLLVLGRPSGSRPLTVVVAPLSSRRPEVPGADAAAAMVIVVDPEAAARVNDDVLRALFGFTSSELRLVHLLVSGHDVNEAAARLNLSHQTIRTTLKRVFEKTNTHRQAELVALVVAATRD